MAQIPIFATKVVRHFLEDIGTHDIEERKVQVSPIVILGLAGCGIPDAKIVSIPGLCLIVVSKREPSLEHPYYRRDTNVTYP